MFQVKSTVIGFNGDEEKFPCHFQHKIGDEFIYDGEKYIGCICPSVSATLVPRMMQYMAAGPRKINVPADYYVFWYSPVSAKDESMKMYDGIGFRNTFDPFVDPKWRQPKDAFKWPAHHERIQVRDDSIVICGDTRTSVVFKVEVLDLSDKGDAIPYFRREMSILHKISRKNGVDVDKILNEFTKDEIEIPYPALSPVMVQVLSDELLLMEYLETKDSKAFITDKGKKKLENFKSGLSAEEKEALNM
jgi:uncharacterized repeat protein (TIGR04076 family)